MATDPHPNKIVTICNSEGSSVNPNSDRPETTDFFEMQRGMSGIFFKQLEVLTGKFLGVFA